MVRELFPSGMEYRVPGVVATASTTLPGGDTETLIAPQRHRRFRAGVLAGAAVLTAATTLAVANGSEAGEALAAKGSTRVIEQPRGVLGDLVEGPDSYHSLTVKGYTLRTIDDKLVHHWEDTCAQTVPLDVYAQYMYAVGGSGNDNDLYGALHSRSGIGRGPGAAAVLLSEGGSLDLDVLTCRYPQQFRGKSVEPVIRVWIDRTKRLEDEVREELATAKCDGMPVDWATMRVKDYPANRTYFKDAFIKFNIKSVKFELFGESVFRAQGSARMDFPYCGPVNPFKVPKNNLGNTYIKFLPVPRT